MHQAHGYRIARLKIGFVDGVGLAAHALALPSTCAQPGDGTPLCMCMRICSQGTGGHWTGGNVIEWGRSSCGRWEMPYLGRS